MYKPEKSPTCRLRPCGHIQNVMNEITIHFPFAPSHNIKAKLLPIHVILFPFHFVIEAQNSGYHRYDNNSA
jgi:hypothetical protein